MTGSASILTICNIFLFISAYNLDPDSISDSYYKRQPSSHHFDVCLDIIKTNNQAGRKETQGVDYKMALAPSINFQLVMIYFQSEQFVTLKICLLQCVIVTHPVSVTALTWYEK